MRGRRRFVVRHVGVVLWVLAILCIGVGGTFASEPWSADEQTVGNLVALARLYGVLRWFHPSDEAATADWDLAAQQGVLLVRDAGSPEELAETLQTHFAGVAPTLRVFPSASPVAQSPELAHPEGATRVSVMSYRHTGLATAYSAKLGGIYTSYRQSTSLARATQDPKAPLHVDLGAGIEAWVATALFADPSGTFPHSSHSTPAFSGSKPTDPVTEQLADAAVVWSLMAHFYPYFEVVEEDWDQVLATTIRHILEAGGGYTNDDMERDLIVPLEDGHASIRTASAWNSPAIPGLALGWVENRVVVLACDGDAQDSGIRPGDAIISIDGTAALAVLQEGMSSASGSTQRRRYVGLFYLLLGEKSTTVNLVIESRDSRRRSVTLTRTQSTPLSLHALDPVTEIEPGILYIDVTRATTGSLQGARRKMQTARGILVDARGYPSDRGWVDSFLAEAIPSMTLRTPIATLPFQEALSFQDVTTQSRPLGPLSTDAEIVFLIDASAISAAEHQLSYFARAGIGTFVGTSTAGANGNINVLLLPSGNRVAWTGMIAEWPDGSLFHTVGIHPDVVVERTRKGLAESRDEQLEAGLRILEERLGEI